ncbi:hypothetical protein RNZ50_09100 [Paracoccaceae bacterium Fryx2]|nr:hypothetical protein [Paracoccaceae bacterium Fryx2]
MILGTLLRLGTRLRLGLALAAITISALWIAFAKGRAQARAHLAVKQAEARIRSLTIAKDIRHELEVLPDAERKRRLARWMRD